MSHEGGRKYLFDKQSNKSAKHLLGERWHLLKDCGEHIEGGDLGESEVLARPLLQLGIGRPQVGVRQEYLLHVMFDLREQVDKLDVR